MGAFTKRIKRNELDKIPPNSAMVITPLTDAHGQAPGIVRPLNLNRDVPQVMSLLRLVFAPALDADGRRALNALGTKPVTLLRFNQLASGAVPGFVWEADQTIVGNVSIIPTRSRERAIVANVAVHPEHRRQGIALQLMQATLGHLRGRGVKTVSLQVKTENSGARVLYDRLGFDWLGATTLWRASSAQWRLIEADEPFLIRPIRRGEHRKAYAVDLNSQPNALNWPEPLKPDFYKVGLLQRLDQLFNGKQFEAWVVPGEDGSLLATASISGEWGRAHRLALRVPPARQAELTRPLFAKLLRRLGYLRQRSVVIEHLANDEYMNALLQEANFRPKRTLGTMQLQLADYHA